MLAVEGVTTARAVVGGAAVVVVTAAAVDVLAGSVVIADVLDVTAVVVGSDVSLAIAAMADPSVGD